MKAENVFSNPGEIHWRKTNSATALSHKQLIINRAVDLTR